MARAYSSGASPSNIRQGSKCLSLPGGATASPGGRQAQEEDWRLRIQAGTNIIRLFTAVIYKWTKK